MEGSLYFNSECVCVSLYMCSCSRRLCARLSSGSRSTAWCLSVYSTNFWGGEGPQQLLTGCDLDQAHRSPQSWDDLTPDNMCNRYLGFLLLIWCPGELHGKNIESFHQQSSELLSNKYCPCRVILPMTVFQHKVQHSPAVLPHWMVVNSPQRVRLMLMERTWRTPAILDVNQQWRAGGREAHVRTGRGLHNHDASVSL